MQYGSLDKNLTQRNKSTLGKRTNKMVITDKEKAEKQKMSLSQGWQ
jgi:hypothetical protein